MYFVKGLEVVEASLEWARRRYPGLIIRQYPHWLVIECLKTGTYCFHRQHEETLPSYRLRDIYNIAKLDAQATAVVTGAKRADSIWRRRAMGSGLGKGWGWLDVIYPLAGWNKMDVLKYCARQNLPVPSGTNRAATGIGLDVPTLQWLHDQHPADFKKLLEVFPFAEAAIKRREFYGIIPGLTV